MTRKFTSIQNERIIKLWLSNKRYTGKIKNRSFIGNTLFWNNYPVAVKVLADNDEDYGHDGGDIFPENIGEVHAHVVISMRPYVSLIKTRAVYQTKPIINLLNDVILAIFGEDAPVIFINDNGKLTINYTHHCIEWSGRWIKVFKYAPEDDPELYMTGASNPDESGCNLSWNDLRAIIDNMDHADRARNVIVHINNKRNETLDVLTFSFYPHGSFNDIHPSACLEVVYDE
jgi:hypothetical protein